MMRRPVWLLLGRAIAWCRAGAIGASTSCDAASGTQGQGGITARHNELDQNRIWCALVALACDLTAWAQLLALHAHHARRWEPKPAAPADLLPRRSRGPHRPTRRAAPAHSRALGRTPATRDHDPARAPSARLTAATPAPTTQPRPARGPGAHPSDLGRSIMPIRQNHPSNTGSDRSRSPPHAGREIRVKSSSR
jgi:hypothetical protein